MAELLKVSFTRVERALKVAHIFLKLCLQRNFLSTGIFKVVVANPLTL